MNCNSCVYWKAVDREKSYYGACSFHNISRVEFNFSCKDHRSNTIRAGEQSTPDKFSNLDRCDYFKEIM